MVCVREATRRSLDGQGIRADELRSLPHEARVELALAETALARAEVQARKLAKERPEALPASAL